MNGFMLLLSCRLLVSGRSPSLLYFGFLSYLLTFMSRSPTRAGNNVTGAKGKLKCAGCRLSKIRVPAYILGLS